MFACESRFPERIKLISLDKPRRVVFLDPWNVESEELQLLKNCRYYRLSTVRKVFIPMNLLNLTVCMNSLEEPFPLIASVRIRTFTMQ
jgi:hypothetical protein